MSRSDPMPGCGSIALDSDYLPARQEASRGLPELENP